ncbi:hypothetical protein Mro03_08400 [Microbispora rosea subsp. rosea]|nr:hypothetical protein Mro03_08400 [Microbispora rosea subsp. rosea]
MRLGRDVRLEVRQQVAARDDVAAVPGMPVAVGGHRATAGHDGLLRVHPAEDRAEHGVDGGHLRDRRGGRAFEEAGDHRGEHLDVPDLLGRDVHDQVLVLAGHAAVPALEQVLHRDRHLAEGAADELLEFARVHRFRLFWLGLELQAAVVPEHMTP